VRISTRRIADSCLNYSQSESPTPLAIAEIRARQFRVLPLPCIPNSCGTAFRCLMAKGVSSSGKEALSRLRFVMGGRRPRFYLSTGDGLVFAGQAALSPHLTSKLSTRLPDFQNSPFEQYAHHHPTIRLMVSSTSGEGCSTKRPRDSTESGAFSFVSCDAAPSHVLVTETP
jgi:hypothetical protein